MYKSPCYLWSRSSAVMTVFNFWCKHSSLGTLQMRLAIFLSHPLHTNSCRTATLHKHSIPFLLLFPFHYLRQFKEVNSNPWLSGTWFFQENIIMVIETTAHADIVMNWCHALHFVASRKLGTENYPPTKFPHPHWQFKNSPSRVFLSVLTSLVVTGASQSQF